MGVNNCHFYYAKYKRRVPGDISTCLFLFLLVSWLFLFLYLFLYFLNFFWCLSFVLSAVRIRRPPSAVRHPPSAVRRPPSASAVRIRRPHPPSASAVRILTLQSPAIKRYFLATYQCTDNRQLLFALGVKKAVTRSRCWISPQISLELWNETQPKCWNINLYRSREQTTKFVPVTGLIWWGLSAIRKQINRSHSRASQLQWRTHSAGTDWISGAFCSPPKHFVGY